jgi:hypothetical protein
MAESDFYILFIEYVNHAHDVFMGVVSLLSGFLVISYLVAHKLNALLSRVVIGIFSGAMFMLIINMLLTWLDISSIADEIRKFDSNWHAANRTGGIAPLIIGITFCVASLLGYAAAIFFGLIRKSET